jgi:hypothetical protein
MQEVAEVLYADPSLLAEGVHSRRVSSWDQTGGNRDYLSLQPGQTVTLLDTVGPGKVTHIYWTTIGASRFHFRQLILRGWWDGESTPSIESPLGDLFLIPHCTPCPLHSLAAVVNDGGAAFLSWGANLYLPMPFNNAARFDLSYDVIPGHPADVVRFWYHIELEHWPTPFANNVGRLHAQWRRENPAVPAAGTTPNVTLHDAAHATGQDNVVALDATGRGQMVGLHLQVDNLGGGWWGEGDDMVFIDGQPGVQWPPAYHGTGTEEIFGGGACPDRSYAGPYTGFHMIEHPDYSGKTAMYRWCLADPIRFERSLVWSIEHGHANNYGNDYTSVAYWYQAEPHAPFPQLADVSARLPRFPDIVRSADAARAECRNRLDALRLAGGDSDELKTAIRLWRLGSAALAEGRLDEAAAIFASGT